VSLAETTMHEKLNQLAAWRTRSAAGGGERRVTQQRASGKGTARERLASLLDPGSFTEIDAFVRQAAGPEADGAPIGEGVVTGWGRIHGRPVFCFSQDF